jgi:hypothetical protein
VYPILCPALREITALATRCLHHESTTEEAIMSIELIPRADPGCGGTPHRVLQAKWAYTARRVPLAACSRLLAGEHIVPQAGDLMLARVRRIGKHAALEGPNGRRQTLFEGDEIVVACAARYAPDQFDARLPASLAPCHLVAGGGVAGVVIARHGAVSAPTELEPIALLADAQDRPANLSDHALQALQLAPARRPVTFASLGTSMNAGKTTSAAWLIRGLVRSGLRVAAAKVTGTGSGNDPNLLRDAGALRVLDFTDAGYASTCGLTLRELEGVAERLVAHLAADDPDAIVLEVADGLFQRETGALLQSARFQALVDGTIFSSNDAMGACAGAQWLRRHGLEPLALGGTVTRSPLARTEAAAATGLPVLGLDDLGHGATARGLWQAAGQSRAPGMAA